MSSVLKVSEIQDPTNGNTALAINTDGSANMAQQPRLFVTGNNAAYVQTTPIPFPTVVIDNKSGWNTSTNTYTVPIAGDYFVSVCLGIVQTSGTNGYGFAQIQHNGNNSGYSYIQTASGTQYGPMAVTRLFNCAVNDTIRVTWGQSSGYYYNAALECRLTIYMLG